jgi:hypothetical protein
VSLFQSLRQLFPRDGFPLEDFHTEIVATVLQTTPALAFEWLQEIGVTKLGADGSSVSVKPQVEFPALKGHHHSIRVDLVIRLSSPKGTELLFIESKVASKQGADQLQRYADHLALASKETGIIRSTLVYITRDYETVTAPKFPDPSLCEFVPPTRWFHFYRILCQHTSGDTLAEELKTFMKENNMSLGNRFRAADILTLQHLLHVKALMDETLDTLKVHATNIVAVRPTKKSRSRGQLEESSRYVLQFALGNANDLECLVGYWLSDETEDDMPWVGIEINSNPHSPRREEIRLAMRSWSEAKWGEAKPADPTNWWGVGNGKPLRAFLGEDDQIQAIKTFLSSLLDDVADFRKTHPSLPWGTATSQSDAEEKGEN